MCGLPSNTYAGRGFISGPSGAVRDKIFGKGTSAKLLGRLDRIHRSTIGKVVGQSTVDKFGTARSPLPGPGAKNPQVSDIAEAKRKKRFATEEAERDRIFRSLGQTNAPQSTILGG